MWGFPGVEVSARESLFTYLTAYLGVFHWKKPFKKQTF